MQKILCANIKKAMEKEAKDKETYEKLSREVRFSRYPDLSILFHKLSKEEEEHQKTLEKAYAGICET
jgi:rubrerythrin